MSCRRYLFFLFFGAWEGESVPGCPRRGLLQGPMKGRRATWTGAWPGGGHREVGSNGEAEPGPEAGWGQAGWALYHSDGRGRGGEAKGGWNTAVGEGSMQRAATISRFRLIWKGGAGKIPEGVADSHPGLISHSWAAFAPAQAGRKSPWKGSVTHGFFISLSGLGPRLPFNRQESDLP